MRQGRPARHPPEFLLGLWLLAPTSDVLLDFLTLGEIVEGSLDQPLHDGASTRLVIAVR
jgi:hypothetical protein